MYWRRYEEYFHFIHVTPSLRQQVPRETPSAHSFCHRGEWQHSEWVASFPTCARHCPGGLILPHPTQSTEVINTAERFREVGAQQLGLRTHQKVMEISQMPSRSPAVSFLGHLTGGPLSLAHRHPQCSLCFTHLLAISLCAPTAFKRSLCRWLSSACRNPTPLCKYQKRHTKWSISWHCCGVNKQKAVKIGLTLWDWEKIYNLNNFPNKRYEASTSLDKVSGSLRVLNWAGEVLSVLMPSSKD